MNSAFKSMIKELLLYKKYFIPGLIVTMSSGILDILSPRITAWAIDNIIATGDYYLLKPFTALFIVYILVSALLTFLFIKILGKLEIAFSNNLREKVFKKIHELELDYFNKNDDGWIIARITSDITKLGQVMSFQFVDSFYFIVIIVFSIISIFIYSPKAGLIVLIGYPILFSIIYIIRNKILIQYREVRKQNSIITSAYNGLINGILTIKAMNIEENDYKDFSIENYRMRGASRLVIRLQGLFVPVIITLGYLIYGLVLKTSADQYILGELTIGQVSAVAAYILLLFETTSELSNILSELQHAQANAERVFTLLQTEVKIKDTEEVIDKYGTIFDNVDYDVKCNGKIEFKNLKFGYTNDNLIFNDLNLSVEPGQSVALVGSTGSGKTTLVNLLSRFYEPISGQILIDGKNQNEYSINWLHHNIGHVLQHPFLFTGTVRDNIRFNHNVTDDKIAEVCQLLGLDDMISKLADGLDTEVGEGGSKLSVGEKQLISFARALINDPKIIILDEATSSIDSESEELVQLAVDKIMQERTSFIVAHRLSTIRKCDMIVYLKNGEIMEKGSHEELLNNKSYYYDLYYANQDF